MRSLIGHLPAARSLPDVHQILRNQRQTAINVWDFIAVEQQEMAVDPRHWDRSAVHITDKGKKQAVSGEASGSGNGILGGSGRLGGNGRRAGSGKRVGVRFSYT